MLLQLLNRIRANRNYQNSPAALGIGIDNYCLASGLCHNRQRPLVRFNNKERNVS